jgi:glyoxylase-like metal-dependent hydrolase (beta-lactamase superfamily II)
MDHCQNAGEFADYFGAEVIAHENAIPILSQSRDGFEAFEYWELVEEAFPRIFNSRFNWLYRRLILMGNNYIMKRWGKKVMSVTPIKDGDIIDLGDMELEIFFAPGHSDDSICLIEKRQQLLFTGDMIPWTPYIHTNIEDFQRSIEKIIESSQKYDVKMMIRGHQQPLKAKNEVRNYQFFLRDMKRAQARILALLGKNGPLTSKQMLPFVFRRSHFTHQLIYRIFMRTQQFWIAKYLHNLEKTGFVNHFEDGKKTFYSLVK